MVTRLPLSVISLLEVGGEMVWNAGVYLKLLSISWE
jgi:hypothetical protein